MFIWIFGLIVFVVCFGLFIWTDGWHGIENFVLPIILGITGLLVALLASVIISFWVPQSAVGEVGRSEVPLIALKDNMAIEGYRSGKYVYRGYIGEELQYTYLYEVKDKGVTSGRCDADKTYVNYTKDAEQPKLVVVEYNIVNPVWKFFSADDKAGISHRYEYYLYVPEGSIVAESEYEIDLE